MQNVKSAEVYLVDFSAVDIVPNYKLAETRADILSVLFFLFEVHSDVRQLVCPTDACNRNLRLGASLNLIKIDPLRKLSIWLLHSALGVLVFKKGLALFRCFLRLCLEHKIFLKVVHQLP